MAAGFLLGLAAGLPSLTRKQVHREVAAELAAKPAPAVPPAAGSYEPPAPTA